LSETSQSEGLFSSEALFHNDVTLSSESIVRATTAYLKLSKISYNFEVIMKLLKGLAQASPSVVVTKYNLVRFWAHECVRQFVDPLASEASKECARGLLARSVEEFDLEEKSAQRVRLTLKDYNDSPLLFGDIGTFAGSWIHDPERDEDTTDDKVNNRRATLSSQRSFQNITYREVCSCTEPEEDQIPKNPTGKW
ncbi:hypothetical protein TrCOL_g4975, partial [Triparma columacea]